MDDFQILRRVIHSSLLFERRPLTGISQIRGREIGVLVCIEAGEQKRHVTRYYPIQNKETLKDH